MTIEQAADIELLPARRPAQSDAIGQLMEHAAAMSAAKQLAVALCDTDLVPATYRGKPGNGAAAILYGAELGLSPIQSLQQIFVVHGAPAIYARTAVAMVKSHGVIIETVSTADDAVTVRGTDTRTGQVEESTWDIPRATKAGYSTNKKYQTDPQAMLYAKAAMEVCRKIAPDILLGVTYAAEELDLEAPPRRVVSSRGSNDWVQAAIGTTHVDEEPTPTTNGITATMIQAAGFENDDNGRADWLAFASDVIGRPINATREMDAAEAGLVIAKLESGAK